MHTNFYHWHGRAELKPDVAILEPRWNAAAKFAEKLSAADIRSLLRLVLFTAPDPEFCKRFTEALVKLEPTFPPEKNAELLRVMAAAAVHSQMKERTYASYAFALGLQSADFPKGRVEPVCKDVLIRAAEYLAEESENARLKIYPRTLEKIEKQMEQHLTALKGTLANGVTTEFSKAVEAFGRGTAAAMKESHKQFSEVIGRLSEETQFLWWLLGRRSSALNTRRELLTPETYALPAAAEAAERVGYLPPAESVEALLNEVLTQCCKDGGASAPLVHLLNAADADWVKRSPVETGDIQLTPITAILAVRRAGGKAESISLKQLGITTKAKFTPAELSRQYFHELMFIITMRPLP